MTAAATSPEAFPALVLNADFRPLSYYPLSLWSWQDAIKAVFLERVNIVSEYDFAVHSPSFRMQLPSVVSLKSYVKPARNPAFTRFNVFLRDRFECVYCGDGEDLTFGGDLEKDASAHVVLAAKATAELEVSYRTRGLGPWLYSFGADGVNRVRDFELLMTTDFDDVDFPPGTLSPTRLNREAPGRHLTWRFESLVTGQKIGLDPPDRLNPGPFAARVTFFAPVALLFFMTVLVILGMVRGPSLHPMHWFFLSAAFNRGVSK